MRGFHYRKRCPCVGNNLKRLVGGGIQNPPMTTQIQVVQDAVNANDWQKSKHTRRAIDGIGNVFLLGMTVLISEVIDLTAAKSLEYLMEPCLPKDESQNQLLEDQAVADNVGLITNELELGEFIPIAFE